MILITGASGFVGTALTQALAKQGLCFLTMSRGNKTRIFDRNGVRVIIHLAARVHVMSESATDPLAEFRQSNVIETLALAQSAAEAGVKRFVYVSSIGVNGDTSQHAFTELDEVNPHNHYALSKREAELALQQLALETGLEVVIVRPPLVYGVNAPGNFGRLFKWLSIGLPLPFGAIYNSRSLLYVRNLVDFLILCSNHPKAANETFLLSDGEDVSTTRLLQTLVKAQNSSSRMLPVPASLLRAAMSLLGRDDLVLRLLGNLQVDSSKARKLLSWTPPFGFEAGIHDMFNGDGRHIGD